MRPALKNTLPMMLASACLLVTASCGFIKPADTKLPADAQAALNTATDATGYSLEPDPAIKGTEMFHGYTVLGDLKLSGQGTKEFKQEYIDALQEYQDEKKHHATAANCSFQPRNALRINSADHHVYDYLVCFNCGLITVYKDDAEYWNGQVRGTAVKLNEMLKASHVPVSETKLQ